MHRKADYFYLFKKINLLLTFLKYLLLWLEGKAFFFRFCLEEETFLFSLQPKGASRIRMSDLDIIAALWQATCSRTAP